MMGNNDLVRVTRCIYCCCFIPMKEMLQYGYNEAFMDVGKSIKADGYCDNINIWVKESDYCSQAEPKE